MLYNFDLFFFFSIIRRLTRCALVTGVQYVCSSDLEPSGELDYPSATSEISALSRAQVVAELEAAKAAGRFIFGESEEAALPAADSSLTSEQVRAEAAVAHADGSYAFGEMDYTTAFSVTHVPRG